MTFLERKKIKTDVTIRGQRGLGRALRNDINCTIRLFGKKGLFLFKT